MTQQAPPGRQRGDSQPGQGDERSGTRPDAHSAGSGIAMDRAGSTNTLGDGRTAGGGRNAHKRDKG